VPAADADGDERMEEDGQGEREASAQQQQREKQTISYDKYISMVNLLVSKVAEDETSGSGEGIEGDALIQWYLEQKEEELQSEEDYNKEMALARKVLKKMVKVCGFPSLPSFFLMVLFTIYPITKMLTMTTRTISSWQSA